MGLAITVGILGQLDDPEGSAYYRDRFANLNAALAAEGLDTFDEPSERIPPYLHGANDGFPYSFLHYLRRAFACVVSQRDLRTGPMTEADRDMVMDVTLDWMDLHLLSHSDCDGFYVPVDMDYPLLHGDAMVGSSHALLRELERVAPALGIAFTPDRDDVTEVTRKLLLGADRDETEASPLWRELMVWHTLYRCAKASIAHGAAIVFH